MTPREALLADLLAISERIRGAYGQAREAEQYIVAGQLLDAARLIGSAIGKVATQANEAAMTRVGMP